MEITVVFDAADAHEISIFVEKPYLLMVSLGARWNWSLRGMDCYSTDDAMFIIRRPT